MRNHAEGYVAYLLSRTRVILYGIGLAGVVLANDDLF